MLLVHKGSPELQQRPKYATVSSDGVISGVDGQHVSLSRPQDLKHQKEKSEDINVEKTCSLIRNGLFDDFSLPAAAIPTNTDAV